MPSSLLFAGLVGTWLAVFVPMAARSRRPMQRTSDVALSSRVLERPVRVRPGGEEVSVAGTRYRPGRGGYDPEAAALAARARYTFRQRVVLTLVLLAATGAGVAVGLKVPEAWWVHGGAVACLALYLVHLRRQVRSEQEIRARRAARSAGNRRTSGRARTGAPPDTAPDTGTAPDTDTDTDTAPDTHTAPDTPAADAAPGTPSGASAGRGRVIERGRSRSRARRAAARAAEAAEEPKPKRGSESAQDELDELSAHLREAPVAAGPDPATEPADTSDEPDRGTGRTSALPLLEPVPLPAQPAGTHRLELDDEDPELHYLDHPGEPWGYRRAAGQ